jgi:hypothetical protein
MPIILAIQEAEIRRITGQSQTRKIVGRPYCKKTHSSKKKRSGGGAQGVGPEFKKAESHYVLQARLELAV